MAGCLACLAAGQGAAGQVSAEEDWHRREFLPNSDGPDEAMAVGYWLEDTPTNKRWVFATGYVTTPNGATVMATYKYDATYKTGDPGSPLAADPAYYPADWQNAVGDHRAMAITVDQATGDVYITGWSTVPGRTDRDYLTIKYDKDLEPSLTWQGTEPGVRRWNSPNDGDDYAVDLAFDGHERLAVTGTSDGFGTGTDIVTLLYDTTNGGLVWSNPDYRRWNNEIITDSPDVAAKVGILTVVETQQSNAGAAVVVAGTTWNGQQNGNDFITLFYNHFGEKKGEEFYDGPASGNDDCRDLNWYQADAHNPHSATIIVAGTSQNHSSAFGGPPASFQSAPANRDYAIVTYDFDSMGQLKPMWDNVGSGPGVRLWDGPAGEDDNLTGVAFWQICTTACTQHVWATGYSYEGSSIKLSTIVFDMDEEGDFLWESVASAISASETGAWAISSTPVDSLNWGDVYVAGWTKVNSDVHTMAARYRTSDDPQQFQVEWIFLTSDELLPHWANAVVAETGQLGNVFTAGAGEAASTGLDFKISKVIQDTP